MSPRACVERGCGKPAGYDLYCKYHYDDKVETFQCDKGHRWEDVAAGTCPICQSSECYLIEEDGVAVPV